MRFLGIGTSCDLGALYLRLLEGGHEVKVAVTEPMAAGTLAGLLQQVADWRNELDWVRAVGQDGVILFESVAEGSGALQDALRRDGFQVIGGSAWGDRLENDRGYAQAILAELGFSTARVWQFEDGFEADRFILANPARYVLKFNGPNFYSSDNYVGQLGDGQDVRAVLRVKSREHQGEAYSFILMEHLDGVEMGVGAYFDGRSFITPACIDWEHKRFFAGDLGELTGEMGTVASYERSNRFFERTLAKLEPHLRDGGYVGYINLNTIVNEHGIWPLEFTCRFGYPGFATLDPLQETSWADLFRAMVTRSRAPFRTRLGFSVAVVLTTPPFPYTRHQIPEPAGLPVIFQGDLDAEERANIHYGEVGLSAGELVTTGLYGWTMVVTGVGETLPAAQAKAYRLAGKVFTPNLRYRLDIGDRLTGGEYARLNEWGYLDEVAPIPV